MNSSPRPASDPPSATDMVTDMTREDMTREIIRLGREQGLTLATAESCTGGLIANALTDQPGASACFHGAIIAYDNRIKETLLGIPSAMLEQDGAVSAPVAALMAQNARSHLAVDIALSVSGIAGPSGGTIQKPVGTVFIALADQNDVKVDKFIFDGPPKETENRRQYIRRESCSKALKMMVSHLKDS